MQKIIQFTKRNFWSSQIDVRAMNQKLMELTKRGCRVESLIPTSNIFGNITCYTVLLDTSGASQGASE